MTISDQQRRRQQVVLQQQQDSSLLLLLSDLEKSRQLSKSSWKGTTLCKCFTLFPFSFCRMYLLRSFLITGDPLALIAATPRSSVTHIHREEDGKSRGVCVSFSRLTTTQCVRAESLFLLLYMMNRYTYISSFSRWWERREREKNVVRVAVTFVATVPCFHGLLLSFYLLLLFLRSLPIILFRSSWCDSRSFLLIFRYQSAFIPNHLHR